MFPPKINGTLIDIHYTQYIKMHTIHALTCCWIWLFKRQRIRYENINRQCVFRTRIWHTHSETKRNKSPCILFNILTPRQNGHRFADDIYKCIFLNANLWISIKLSLKFVPIIGSDNGLAPTRRPLSVPMMVRSPMYIIYASLGLNELMLRSYPGSYSIANYAIVDTHWIIHDWLIPKQRKRI